MPAVYVGGHTRNSKNRMGIFMIFCPKYFFFTSDSRSRDPLKLV